MPDWLAVEYLKRFRRVLNCEVASWDVAFDRPFKKGIKAGRLRQLRTQREKSPAVWLAVNGALAAGIFGDPREFIQLSPDKRLAFVKDRLNKVENEGARQALEHKIFGLGSKSDLSGQKWKKNAVADVEAWSKALTIECKKGGPTISVDRDLFEAIGHALGLSGALAMKLYYAALKELGLPNPLDFIKRIETLNGSGGTMRARLSRLRERHRESLREHIGRAVGKTIGGDQTVKIDQAFWKKISEAFSSKSSKMGAAAAEKLYGEFLKQRKMR
jgi:hypothetical protein